MGRIEQALLDRLVFDLQKPAQYTGGEYNQVVKPGAAVRMGLCYPDLYEVGMSNQGVVMLYAIVNAIEGAACERVFAVAPDFEDKARRMNIPLYTLETHTPLHELDLLGFNVSHELLFTNILQVLDLGGIPLLREERGDTHPVIIAGGEAVSNPAPLEPFIDVFFIGDGEDGIAEIIEVCREAKKKGLGRTGTIAAMEGVEGVYLPSTHRSLYHEGALTGLEGNKVRKRRYTKEVPYVPERPLVPNIRIAQDRAVVEVSRGCKNLCRFCHAGYYELPCREYRPGPLAEKIFSVLDHTGYNELTLSSLSIGDYRFLPALLDAILPRLTARGVSISLPSLRVDLETLPLIQRISDLRRTSLTFAVESAEEDIRAQAGKRLSTDDLLRIIDHVFSHGWRVIKLYFMIGLPGCDAHDEAEAIIRLLKRIHGIGRGRKEINVTISPFVPKPHTPFQWERQMDVDYLETTTWKLRHGAPKSVTIKSHNIRASILEGVLSRGDSRLGEVIRRAYMDGCRMDSWNERFRFDLWEKNLAEVIPGWKEYLAPRKRGELLPWSSIETGFEKLVESQRDRVTAVSEGGEKVPDEAFRESMADFEKKYEVRSRMRLRVSKQGPAKYIPHIDLIEIIKRALRMAEIPVAFTQGFNKRERISLGYPLPVGVESLCELCDVDLHEDIDARPVPALLNSRLPSGIAVEDARRLEDRESLMAATAAMEYTVYAGEAALHRKILESIAVKKGFEKDTKKGKRTLEFGHVVLEHRDEGGRIRLVLSTGDEGSMRVDQAVLALAGLSYDEFFRFRAVRTRNLRRENGGLVDLW